MAGQIADVTSRPTQGIRRSEVRMLIANDPASYE
jgi:hypothetical protein